MRRGNLQSVAVFGHRAARTLNALGLQHVAQFVVAQRFGGRFGGNELLQQDMTGPDFVTWLKRR